MLRLIVLFILAQAAHAGSEPIQPLPNSCLTGTENLIPEHELACMNFLLAGGETHLGAGQRVLYGTMGGILVASIGFAPIAGYFFESISQDSSFKNVGSILKQSYGQLGMYATNSRKKLAKVYQKHVKKFPLSTATQKDLANQIISLNARGMLCGIDYMYETATLEKLPKDFLRNYPQYGKNALPATSIQNLLSQDYDRKNFADAEEEVSLRYSKLKADMIAAKNRRADL